MKQQAVVVVPVWRAELAWNEEISLAQIAKVFAQEDVVFLLPKGLFVPWLGSMLRAHGNMREERVPAAWMDSFASYNRMMMTPAFYARFRRYVFLLICQLDAFPFSDRLTEFCRMPYDDFGAPWPYLWSLEDIGGRRVRMRTGNGGFSLRRVDACIRLLKRHAKERAAWPSSEDKFFAYAGKYLAPSFRVAPMRIARRFAVEGDAARYVQKNGGQLPFGCHAWTRYSRAFYSAAIRAAGYDLGAHEAEMRDEDDEDLEKFRAYWKNHRRQRRVQARRRPLLFFSADDNEMTQVDSSFCVRLEELAGDVKGETGIDGLRIDFNFGLRLSVPEGDYRVRVLDGAHGQVFFDGKVSNQELVSLEKYAIPWQVEVYAGDACIFAHRFDWTGQRVYFHLGTALGDMLALLPYIRAIEQADGVQVVVGAEENFRALIETEFPSWDIVSCVPDDTYASFVCGAFQGRPMLSPLDTRGMPIEEVGRVLFGWPYPVAPLHLGKDAPRTIAGPYACIAVQASCVEKCWLRPGGWDEIVRQLRAEGYRVLCIDGERGRAGDGIRAAMPDGAEDFTGYRPLPERIGLLAHADVFFGVSSGLSWLAHACGTPVVLISEYTLPMTEFQTPGRVINLHVCHGCYNDMSIRAKDGGCPRHGGTERAFECGRSIAPEAVWEAFLRVRRAERKE